MNRSALLLVLPFLSGCVGEREVPPVRLRLTAARAGSPAPTPAPETTHPGRALPPIAGEPAVRVLIAQGESLSLRLLRPAPTSAGPTLPAGTHVVRAGVSAGSVALGHAPRLDLDGHGAPTFALGDRQFGGALWLLERGGVLAIEELPLERYLEGVLAREVAADWPAAALEAQAVAARSYAVAQWMRRHAEDWHLGASELADMAYAGQLDPPDHRIRAAVEATRGQILVYRGMPVPAYFHAASGGHTEDHDAIWPDRRCPDGVTNPSPAFPAAPDPFAVAGEAAATHRLGAWQAHISLDAVADRLAAAGHPVGSIHGANVVERRGARARRVAIHHAGGELLLDAHALRMAVGPRELRSTVWEHFSVQSGALEVQGRGYGHGVGLPQSSAWAMARFGHRAGEILRRYYPGAELRRAW